MSTDESEDVETAIAYTDGAARGNPGPAGAGAYFQLAEEEKRFFRYLGEATNNQAEYAALLLALEEAQNMGIRNLEIRADSELMVRQITGEYKVRNERLREVFEEAQRRIESFDSFKIVHVPREANQEADRLANQAIDEAS